MEESKSQDHHDEFPSEKIKKEIKEGKNEQKLISNGNAQINENNDLTINQNQLNIDKDNNENKLEDNKKTEINSLLHSNIDNNKDNVNQQSEEIIKEKTFDEKKLAVVEANSNKTAETSDNGLNVINKNQKLENNKIKDSSAKLDSSIDRPANDIKEEIKENKTENTEDKKKIDLNAKSNIESDKIKNNSKQISTPIPVKAKIKPVKEPPIEKKPFLEFVNDHLIPEIKNEFKLKGKEINKINIQKTERPIAEDKCWVIYCEIKDTCNFWLSFEKDDITSLKSFSLCKNYEKPSIIESFLIDEKKITLKLIISRILQRLNGQKLIGAN